MVKGEGLLGSRPIAVSLAAAGFTSLHGKLGRTRGHWLWSGVSVHALRPPPAGELWLWPGLRVTGLHLPGTGLVCRAEAQLAGLGSSVVPMRSPVFGFPLGQPQAVVLRTLEWPVSQPLAAWWLSACSGDTYLSKKGAVQMLMLGALSYTYRSLVKHTHKIVMNRSFI